MGNSSSRAKRACVTESHTQVSWWGVRRERHVDSECVAKVTSLLEDRKG